MRASFLPETIYLSIYLSRRARSARRRRCERSCSRGSRSSHAYHCTICRVADGTIATLNDHNRVVQCRNGSVCNTAYRAMVRVSAAQDELMRSVSDLRGLARQALSGKATAWCGLCASCCHKMCSSEQRLRRKQGRRCKVGFSFRAFALLSLSMEGISVCGLPAAPRGGEQYLAFWSQNGLY